MGVLSFLGGIVTWAAGQAGILAFLPHAGQVAVQAVAGLLTVLGIRKAATDPSVALTDVLNHLGSGWKTAVGVVVWVVGALLAPDVFNTLPANVAHIVQAIGGVLAALGLYHRVAVNKAG